MREKLKGWTGNDLTLGNHWLLNIQGISGLESIPHCIEGERLLVRRLEDDPLQVSGVTVGRTEFYLCYSINPSFLFLVEYDRIDQVVSQYRPQFGANGNYHTFNKFIGKVRIWPVESLRHQNPGGYARIAAFL